MTTTDPNNAKPKPTSNARIEANRRNAQRSTGPRTAAGKERSSRNGWRHGLTATNVVAPGEDAAAFDHYRLDMRLSLQPANSMEEDLVERIVVTGWKRRRLEAWEQRVFNGDEFNQREFDNLLRYRRTIDREYHASVADLDRMQKNRDRANRIESEGKMVEWSEGKESTPFSLKQSVAFMMMLFAKVRRDRLKKDRDAQGPQPAHPAPVPAAAKPAPVADPKPEEEVDETNPFNRMVLDMPGVRREDCLVAPGGLLIPPMPA
ncbi:MAG: hypothetical protein AB7K09_08385 [Planctomycetota bacterium]